jgi:hypothetical protein
MTRAVLLLCTLSLAGCNWWNPTASGNPGNPSGMPYAGEPGSVFANVGPPRPVGPESSYNPAIAPPPRLPVTSGALPPVSPPR